MFQKQENRNFYIITTFLFICIFATIDTTPVIQQYCPVFRDNGDGTTGKVINMDAVEGRKLRLQFSYPNEIPHDKVYKGEVNLSGETTTAEVDVHSRMDNLDATTIRSFKNDIYCSWDFRTGNGSQFLLITFDKMSAPFTEDCTDAFIAMQKNNAFESRWCGNRKQASSRPITLFSKGTAKISVFHKSTAPTSPFTGFTVVVEAVDASMIEGNKNALRVLLG